MEITEKEILKEPAGERLDKWVAEIFLELIPCDKWEFFSLGSAGGPGYKKTDCGHSDSECYPIQLCPHYSRNFQAMEQIIQKFQKDKKRLDLEIGDTFFLSNCDCEGIPLKGWDWEDGFISVESEDIKLTFCRFALLTKLERK